MYTIKQASIRTGVGVPLLRAWERRYGIPTPSRTASGYRLYDETALDRIRQMRSLVSNGWAPSQAAKAVLEGTAPLGETGLRGETEPRGEATPRGTTEPRGEATPRGTTAVARAIGGEWTEDERPPLPVERFVAAAAALDEASLDESLDEAFATLRVEEAIDRFALPALVAVGDAWAAGTLDVSGEHAASSAVMRRLGALYEAAGQPAAEVDAIVGLPPRGRHEAGALAFAVACRRIGIRVLYLGADVPLESWLTAVRAQPQAAVVLGAVSRDEARSAADVVRALRSQRSDQVVAIGGAWADEAVEPTDGILILPRTLRAAVAALRGQLAR